MNLVFLGKQGVGKGTYAQRLSQIKKIPHLSMGDMFREEAASGSEIGKKIQEVIDSGQLVLDELTAGMMKKRLQQPDCQHGFILDGFPRNLKQAGLLDEILVDMGKKLDAVVEFTADDEVLMERLTARRQCKNCNRIYNLLTIKPKRDGICDICGGELYHREDDRPDAIRKRFAIYEEKTKSLTDEYKKRGLLVQLRGDRDIDAVVNDLVKLTDSKKR